LAGKTEPLELSLAHAAWLGACFGWLVLFWWWEYRFASRVEDWTVGLYFFLVLYAVTLFLMSVVLVPRTWDGVRSLKEYFLQRRVWFYGLYLIGNLVDVIDGLLKGGLSYWLDDVGVFGWGLTLTAIPVCLIGMKIRNMTYHNYAGVVIMVWQFLLGFGALPVMAV
jgi:hypothetical protein